MYRLLLLPLTILCVFPQFPSDTVSPRQACQLEAFPFAFLFLGQRAHFPIKKQIIKFTCDNWIAIDSLGKRTFRCEYHYECDNGRVVRKGGHLFATRTLPLGRAPSPPDRAWSPKTTGKYDNLAPTK